MATVLSLPVLSSVIDCADFSLTVKPYIPQLLDLPNSILSLASSDSKLHDAALLYLNTNPLITAFSFALFLGVVVLVAAEVNRNYSQIDRLWSILPAFYIAHYTFWAHQNGLPTSRLDNVMTCAGLWSARLTYNYWRRGGYQKGSEDYRWPIIKERIGPMAMFILNLTFISFGQSILLFLVSSPAYILMLISKAGSPKMDFGETIFSRIFLGLILVEFFADLQQWNYQEAKRKYKETASLSSTSPYSQEDLERGFNVSGLWSWSRHPNLFAEQSIWVVLYQWGCYASDSYVNWTLAGAAGYVMVIQTSTILTEMITSSKYPEYEEYQRLVGKFLPRLFPAAHADEAAVARNKAASKKIAIKKE